MKTLKQFKQEEGISTIDLLKLNGRAFAQVNDKSLIVSSKCDMTLPLFVTPIEKDKNDGVLVNVYALVNSQAQVVASI